MGLQEILKEIQDTADAENSDVLREAKLQAEKIVLEKAAQLGEEVADKQDALEIELKKLSAKLMARAELDIFRERQRSEVEMVESILQEAYQKLLESLRQDSAKYQKFLNRLATGALKMVEGKEAGIILSKEDEKYFPEIQKSVQQKISLLPSVKMAGGVICVAGDTYIDNSLENIFNRMRPDFVKIIWKVIE